MLDKLESGSRDIVCIYTTCGNKEEARSIAISAIKEKLAVSIDYWIMDSIYPWGGVIREVNQYMVSFTTQKSLVDRLIKHIESRHSYNIPVIIGLNVPIVSKQYNFWTTNILANNEIYRTETEYRKIQKSKEEAYYKLK